MTEEIAAVAPPGEQPPPGPPALPDPTQKRLTKRERQFVAEYLVDLNGAQAVRRCGWYKGTKPRQKAWRMLKRPHVRAAVDKALEENRGRAAEKAEQAKLLVEAQAFADPNELVQFRREACRYCWGIGHRQQSTAAEQERRRADYDRVLVEWQAKHPGSEPIAFDEMGGVGFNPKRDPHPECPECFGDGTERMFVHDTRKLSPEARALYAGIKQTEKGIEVKTNSQDKAREMYLKLTGQLTDRLEHTGKGGTTLALPVINIGFANGGPGEPVTGPKGP